MTWRYGDDDNDENDGSGSSQLAAARWRVMSSATSCCQRKQSQTRNHTAQWRMVCLGARQMRDELGEMGGELKFEQSRTRASARLCNKRHT